MIIIHSLQLYLIVTIYKCVRNKVTTVDYCISFILKR